VQHNVTAKRLKIPQRRTTTLALLDEPHGWRQLHAMAQQERDPQRLSLLIEQMNSLLDQHERMATDENPSTSVSLDPENLLKLDVQTRQYDA
jgi:hypothetical protein